MHATTNLTTAIATAGLIFAACGDDPEPLSKPQFVAQANAICQTTNDQLVPIFENVWAIEDDVDPTDPANELLIFARWDEAMDEVVPIVDEQLDDLRELSPPAEDEDLIETLFADQESAIADFAGLMDAAAGGDQAAMAELELDDPFDDINRRAREYGLTVCGEE
ncbi:MAG: hypothetical protein QNM02_13020 [Acidimicrobiia bacterium]|nr:hypothetical protein [Acidimicrobiia bacterium]